MAHDVTICPEASSYFSKQPFIEPKFQVLILAWRLQVIVPMKSKQNETVDRYMTQYPFVAGPKMSVIEAMSFMKKNNIRHLPVARGSKIVGIVSDRDLRIAEFLSDSMQLTVSDFMIKKPYCVASETPLSTVAAQMATKRYGCAIVLGKKGEIKGIFTTTDGMSVLSKVLSKDSNSKTGKSSIERYLDDTFLI